LRGANAMRSAEAQSIMMAGADGLPAGRKGWALAVKQVRGDADSLDPAIARSHERPAMKVRVHVSLKPGVLDPQGRAIQHSLEGLGFSGVHDVRAGKLLELDVDDDTSDAALDEMCRKLLANMVIENYRVEKLA